MSWNGYSNRTTVAQRLGQKQTKRRRGRGFPLWAFVVLAVIVIGGVVAGWQTMYWGTHRTVTCTVESKDHSYSHNSESNSNDSVYRVYTKASPDCGVFNVTDVWYAGKFNSADTYGQLEPKSTYQLEVVGFRNGFFSWFPNILSAKQVGHE